MSGIFGGKGTQITTYSGLQVQTTSASDPVPIVYGQNMLTPTCVWYNGFTNKKKGSKGGKGGILGGGGGETVYYVDLIMAVCEGPISQIPWVYQTSITPITLGDANLSLMTGTIPQTPWSYVTTNYPSQALSYAGIAYVYASNWDIGPSASIGNNSLVVDAVLFGSGFNAVDADPPSVIYDFMTNAYYGAGFPTASINFSSLFGSSGDASLQTYCWASGLAFSPVLNRVESANTTIERWLKLLNATVVWSEGVLNFVPFGTEPITGNGRTWTPSVTVQYILTDDDFEDPKSEDPVVVTRSDPYACDNYLMLEIVGRDDNFNVGPIPAFDQSAIDRFGLRIGSIIEAHEFTVPAIAQTSAQLILQRGLYIRDTFQFKLSWEFFLLDPMDYVTLTDSYLGMSGTLARITAIEEADDGKLTFTAEEVPVGVGTPITYSIQAGSNGAPNTNVVPNPVNAPTLFEPPPSLVSSAGVQIWACVSPQGGDPNWGGYIVNASFDGTSYEAVQNIYGSSTMGVLTAGLAAYSSANPDTTDTLSVDLSMSAGALTTTTMDNAANGSSLCLVGSEFLTFETATLTSAHKYNLTTLYRGLYGVPSTASSSGAQFAYLGIGSNVGKFGIPSATVGATIYFKFQSYNIFGNALEDISTCTAYTYTVGGGSVISAFVQQLLLGIPFDCGSIAAAVTDGNAMGGLSSPVTLTIDLGTAP